MLAASRSLPRELARFARSNTLGNAFAGNPLAALTSGFSRLRRERRKVPRHAGFTFCISASFEKKVMKRYTESNYAKEPINEVVYVG